MKMDPIYLMLKLMNDREWNDSNDSFQLIAYKNDTKMLLITINEIHTTHSGEYLICLIKNFLCLHSRHSMV